MCGFPGSPAHGYVKLDQDAYNEGDVVTYSCQVGYILLGSPVSRCTEDGSWTREVPICGKRLYLVFSLFERYSRSNLWAATFFYYIIITVMLLMSVITH